MSGKIKLMSHTARLKPLCLLHASLSGAFCDTQHWVFDVYHKAAIQADKKGIDASPLK